MKKNLIVILVTLLMSMHLSGTARSGQVLTDDIKQWAHTALKQEQMLNTAGIPENSVAVLYFQNMSGNQRLKPLQKGLTLMLITDLSKLKEIQLLERIKVQALMDELDLTASGLLQADASTRIGKLIGAKYLVGGEINKAEQDRFNLNSNLFNTKTKNLFDQPEVNGQLVTELIRMEKDLLFLIIRDLNIEITAEQEAFLKIPLSNNTKALMFLFQAIDFSDRGDYRKANEYYEKALEEDAGLELAQSCIDELQVLGLLAKEMPAETDFSWEAYSEDSPDDRMNDNPELLDRPFDGKEANEREDLITLGNISVNLNFSFTETADRQPATVDSNAAQDDLTGDYSQYIPGNLLSDGTWTDGYAYGLQTVGQNGNTAELFINATTLTDIQNNDLIAYRVQNEEDLLNQRALDLHRQQMADQEALDAINDVMDNADLRERDAWLEQNADAQAGRVLKDREGHWVRVQQYILRPDANTVQLLSVSYRSGNSSHSGLSTINWITRFNQPLAGNVSLQTLPWSDWLNIQQTGNTKFINYPNADVTLNGMSVAFSNPQNELFQESVQFSPMTTEANNRMRQAVATEQLTLVRPSEEAALTYTNDYINQSFAYSEGPAANAPGLQYTATETGTVITEMAFTVRGDINAVDPTNVDERLEFQNIWDVMRINENNAVSIGNNNLEITVDPNRLYFSQPIDVIYIPMSRMLWKNSDSE